MLQLKKTIISVILLACVFTASAVTLFEIKDEVGSPVLVVSSDGLRILNGTDTLMVISSTGIKAFIDESKVLPRTFSVSTSTGSASSVLDVTTDGMRIYDQSSQTKALGDTLMTISSRSIKAHIASGSKGLSRSFSVATSTSKGLGSRVLEVAPDSTVMRESGGDNYSNFSPKNIFLGLNSGTGITIGSGNTFMGNRAGMSNTTGNSNVMIGENAGRLWNGSYGNVFIGEGAADSLLSGHRNVMIGYRAGAVMETGATYGNVYLGAVAGKRVSGNYNVMIGEAAGENYYLGSDAGYSVFVGRNAGRYNTGDYNICIGNEAGSGDYNNPVSGSHNIFIGKGAKATDKTDSYRLAIGDDYGDILYGRMNGAKLLVVNGNLTNNTNQRTFFVNGDAGGLYSWYNDSDERLKKNIRTIDGALDRVMKLRGVSYEWKDENSKEKGRKLGFIAQESKDIIPEAVDYNAENDRYTMQYATITAVLVEAIKELKQEISSGSVAQDEKINTLIKENKELKSKVQELESLRAEIELIKSQLSGYTSR